MRRRDLIALMAGAATGHPLRARAQATKVPMIAVLVVQSPGSEEFWRGLREAMRQLGYIEGQNIRFEFRSDQGQQSQLPDLAAELVHLKPDVIVAWFTPAVRAVKEATSTIPIVTASGGVEAGLVTTNFARPNANLTGISSMGAELDGKLIQLIRELLPSAHRVAALANASDPFSTPFTEKVEQAGRATSTVIDMIRLKGREELEAGFMAVQKNRPDAVIVQPSLGLKQPADLALQARIPAVEHIREFAEAGGLMTYSPRYADLYPRVAAMVDKLLKGAKPADLPVEQPDKFELVINLKTAKALGIAVPQFLLAQAGEVIE